MFRIFFGGFTLDDLYVILYMIEDAMDKYEISLYLKRRLDELHATIINHLDHIQYDD